jgi:iron complex outermembrane recepter protein
MRTRNVATVPRRLGALEKRLVVATAVAAALSVTLPAHAEGPAGASGDALLAQNDAQRTNSDAQQAKSTIKLAQVSNGPSPAEGGTAKASDQLTEVVVTGSRIKRRDYESQSPIVTVNADAFENKSSVAIESTMNQLPQFRPSGSQSALSPAQNPFPSATATQGAETLDLRGLGANRTLVLFDGRRAQPINATLAVDLNTIPVMAIDSVETITGGAASTYGADAIAGVVNFKLKKNFQGFEADAQYGISQEGDDRETQISILTGTNFADDKGNIMLSASYADRSGVQGRDRAWVRSGWNDPGTSGGTLGGTSRQYAPGFFNTPATGGFLGPNSSQYYIDPNGKLYDVNAPLNPAHPYTGPMGATNLGIYKINPNGSLGFNATDNDELQIPLVRWSAFGVARYQFNDHLSTFLELNYSESKTTFTGFHSSNDTAVWVLNIPYSHLYDDPNSPTFGQANATAAGVPFHPVPAQLAALLNARTLSPFAPPGTCGGVDCPWTYSATMYYVPGFTDISTSNVYQFTWGFDGDVPGTDWSWEVYGSHGRTNNIQEQPEGFPSLSKMQTLLNANMYGQNWSNPDTLAVTGHCTSGLPVFNADGSVNLSPSVSKDCADWFLLRMNTLTQVTQETGEADLTGSLLDMPFGAGRLRFALGADFRSDDFNFNPDSGFNANQDYANVLQNIILPVGVQGGTNVKEAYTEFSIPILKDKPFAKSIEIDPGYRYSRYNTATGGVSTFKLLGNWTVTDWIKFRGGIEVANRAPNIAELFTPPGSSQITGTSGTITPDPCAYFSVTPSWGNTPVNPNRYNMQALCQYLMIRQGNSGQYMVPGGTANTYNYTVFGPAPFNGAFPFSIAIIQGNQNLKSETARTATIGTVLTSPFEAALISHLSLSVDWYRIKLDNAIAVADYNAVYQECLDAQFNKLVGSAPGSVTGAQMFAGSPACQYINRETTPGDPWGAGRNYNAPYINEGGIKSEGVDAELDWSVRPADMGAKIPGSFSMNAIASYLKEYAVQTFGGSPFVDDTGTTVNSSFRYKLFSTFAYTVGRASVGFRWQHLPYIGPPPGSPAVLLGTQSYNQVDMFGHWALTDAIDLRFGMDNVLNAWPRVVGAQKGINNNATVTSQDYDTLGRRFFVGMRAKF